jgi:MinD superfamily P-loop ATPase
MFKGTIAIASGKGGTGKTTISLNLAAVVSDSPVTVLDCDVEEPNAHLFLKPHWDTQEEYTVLNPVFNENLCSGCGVCRSHCRFNAIAVLSGQPMLFPELCHSCGACVEACPVHAISEQPRSIGKIREGYRDGIRLIDGELNIAEAKSPPLIEGVRHRSNEANLTIIDAPPGTSCPVLAAIKDSDFLVLVTEPTPFGLHNLKLAVEMATALGLRFGVIINRADLGDKEARNFCKNQGISILAELPLDLEIARLYSRGEIPSRVLPRYREIFRDILLRLQKEMSQ